MNTTDINLDTYTIVKWLTIYSISTTLVIVIMIVSNRRKRARYITWKSDKIRFWFWERTWERSEDEFVIELMEENKRFEGEIKVLKKNVRNASITLKLTVLFFVFVSLFALSKSRKS